MKAIKISFWLLALASLANSCSKNNSSAGGSTTAVADSISVNSISPAQPYVDDIITINGSNFNPDPAKDTVVFGVVLTTMGANGLPGFAGKVGCQVISASATQLKVKLATVSGGGDPVQAGTFAMTNPVDLSYAKGFYIAANGKRKILPVPFKFLPSFSAASYTPNTVTQNDFTKNYAGCTYGTYAAPYLFVYEGDSLLLDGFGLSNPSITINGKALSFTVKENTNKTQHAAALVPFGFFAEADPAVANRCPVIGTRVLEIKVTNPDGKTTVFNRGTYFPSPNTGIYSYGLNTASFQQSNINSQPIYSIVGYALRSTTQVRVVGSRNGNVIYNQIVGTVPGGYPNQYSVQIDMKALPGAATGGDVYTVSLIQDGSVVRGAGLSGFTLNP